MEKAKQIRAIIYKEGELWVAQCLEYDIGAQASDLKTLQSRLQAVMFAELNESLSALGKPFAGIDPAPAHFFEQWEESNDRLVPKSGSSIRQDSNELKLDMALCA